MNKKLILLAVQLLGVILLFSSCNNDAQSNPTASDFYALDISHETDWDYLVAADNNEGSSVWCDIDRTSNIPTMMFFKASNNNDYGFTLKFKNNGQPDYAIFGDTIVAFENFKGTKCDFAVIYPNISIKYSYNVETGIDWDNINSQQSNLLGVQSVSPETTIAINHSIKFIGASLAVVGAVAAFSTVGLPLAIAGAVITTASIANSYFGNNNLGVGLSCDVAGHVATLIGCAVAPPAACVSSLALSTSSFAANAYGYANDRAALISIAQAHMQNNNGNPDNPNNPDDLINKTINITLTSSMGGGGESFTVTLKNNRVLQVEDVTGSWELGGSSLRMNWTLNNQWHCTYTLTGTLNSNQYSGSYTHYDYGSTLYDKGTFYGTVQ